MTAYAMLRKEGVAIGKADYGPHMFGHLRADAPGGKDVGKNSGLSEGWLPPDPPTGHGSHDYVFQLLALRGASEGNDHSPGRSDFIDHVAGRILAAGVLVATYARGEEAVVSGAEIGAPAIA